MTTPTHRLNAGCNWNLPTGRCGRKASPYPAGPRCELHPPGHHLKTNDNSKGGEPA